MTAARRSLRQRAGDARVSTGIRLASLVARLRGQRVVHMLHVGKTGGTAVKAALESAARPDDLLLMLHPHRVSLRDVPAGDEVFLFLRDPLTRFVSGFESRRREGRHAHYHPWTPSEKRSFARFETPDALALAIESGDPDRRMAAQKAMRSIGHVRTHLSDWLGDQALVRKRRDRIVLIGWQETLEADFRRLVERLGLPPETSLPADDSTAHRAPTEVRRPQLSADAARIMSEWYAGDYALIDLLEELGLTTRPKDRL